MPYRETIVRWGPDWQRIAKEVAATPGGIATLRILQAHGVNKLSAFVEGDGEKASNSIENFMNAVVEATR
jgi:hypothetical protein